MRGRFITFEGIDGAGKSTQIAAVVARLRQAGHEVVQSREPGGTPLGEALRQLLLNGDTTVDAAAAALDKVQAQAKPQK